MSKLTSNQASHNTSKIINTGVSTKSKKKGKNTQEMLLLKKLVKSEVREAKGQELVNTYIKLIEREYESLIEKTINDSEIIQAQQKSIIFQKVLNKAKSKINSRAKSKKNSENNSRSLSFYNNKLTNSKSSLNITPIKKSNKKKENVNENENQNKENSNQQSTYWKDYEFLKLSSDPTRNPKNIKNKNNKGNSSNENLNNTISSIKEKQLEDYYIYLLNRRKKICESKETDESQQQEKVELEIVRKIFEKIFNEDEKHKKYLEDEN